MALREHVAQKDVKWPWGVKTHSSVQLRWDAPALMECTFSYPPRTLSRLH